MLGNQIARLGALTLAACFALTACAGGDNAGADSLAAGDSGMAMGADTGMAPAGGMAQPGAMSDPQIVAQVSNANGKEIATGRIAQEKARNADVKSFAADMVKDHQAMQGGLDSLVTSANITPQASQPDTLQQALDDATKKLQDQAAGADFDRAYMDMMVSDHEATLNLLNQAASSAQNAELRTLIQGAIPKVQGHLDRARQIRGALGNA
jgi:putative membrane protein